VGELVLWYGTFAPCGALLGNNRDCHASLSHTRHLILHHLLSELFFSEALYEFTSFPPNNSSWIPNKRKVGYLAFILLELAGLNSKDLRFSVPFSGRV
jgi:hypothetical protein